MPNAAHLAAAIDLREHQLEAQGVRGIALANQMLGYMAGLDYIYRTASDAELSGLCRRFPGFERYARLMEEVSERNEAMTAAGTHPHADLPQLPEPLKASLMALLRGAAEIEREFQSAVDVGRIEEAGRLAAMRRRWADDLEKLVEEFRSADLPVRTEAWVQQVVKAAAGRIQRLA